MSLLKKFAGSLVLVSLFGLSNSALANRDPMTNSTTISAFRVLNRSGDPRTLVMTMEGEVLADPMDGGSTCRRKVVIMKNSDEDTFKRNLTLLSMAFASRAKVSFKAMQCDGSVMYVDDKDLGMSH